jgi:hypothetical protein
MSVEEVRLRADGFHRKVSWRNARESFAALAATVFLAVGMWQADDAFSRLGYALAIAGLAYMCWHLFTGAAPRRMPQDLGTANCLVFHRRELERQRDMLLHIWRWYLGPMVPGLVVLLVAVLRLNPRHRPHFGLMIAGYGVVFGAFFVFVWWLNQRAANCLQRKIDELDRLAGGDR